MTLHHYSEATVEAAVCPVRQAGFADPVHDAQQFFRVLLTALARPCQPQPLPPQLPEPPSPLTQVMGAALLTLCDGDTPVWLAPEYDTPAVRAWLRFHTSCPLTGNPSEAAFAAAPAFTSLPVQECLAAFAQGQPAFPDRSTTVLVGIPSLGDVPVPNDIAFSATGPGIQERALLALPAGGLPADFDHYWAVNKAAYPLGVDMFLLAPSHVLGLPRTTSLARFG